MSKIYERVDFYLYGGTVISSHDMSKKKVDKLEKTMFRGNYGHNSTFELTDSDSGEVYLFYIKDIMMIYHTPSIKK